MGCQDNENVIIAKDAVRFIDAHNVYAATSDRIEASVHMKKCFDRLTQSENWNYYDLKFLVSSVHLIESIEQALELGSKSMLEMVHFRASSNTDIWEGYLALNMCARLLIAKYFDSDIKINLPLRFEEWFSKLERLAEKNSDLSLPFTVTKIRKAIFHKDQDQIFKLREELETNYDEDVVNIVRSEISFYLLSERYNSKLKPEISKLGGEK